jgi:hypothetical protein
VRILEGAIFASHISVDKPELVTVVRKARCPNATAVRLTTHVKLGLAVERPDGEVPVGQILGMVDLDSGIPFEGRSGDVVVLPNPEN